MDAWTSLNAQMSLNAQLEDLNEIIMRMPDQMIKMNACTSLLQASAIITTNHLKLVSSSVAHAAYLQPWELHPPLYLISSPDTFQARLAGPEGSQQNHAPG
eukprot:635550-Pelagomonas_calceolata.AAC.6